MDCQDYNLLMIEDIYKEISIENKNVLENHLKSCIKCQKEYAELKVTAGILNSWEDELPEATVLPFSTFPIKNPKKFLYKISLAAAAVLLIFSLLNFNLTINDNGFNVSFSMFGSPVNSDNLAAEIINNGSQVEQVQLLINLIEESKIKQKEEMVTLLTEFYQAFEMRRQADLKVIAQGMETLRTTTNRRIDDTDQVLDGLIQYTGSILEKGVYIK